MTWQLAAACRNHPDPDLWFPAAGDMRGVRDAKTICNTQCPVRAFHKVEKARAVLEENDG